MHRSLSAMGIASLLALATPAFADTPPTAEDFGGTQRAAPVVAAPPAAPTIRVVFAKKKKNAEARIYREDPNGRDVLVCAPPCAADLPPGTMLRAVVGDGDPHEFSLEGVAGRSTSVMVGTPPRGGLALGIVLTSLGGTTMLIGGIIAAIGATFDDVHDVLMPGLITLGVGGIVTFGGVTLIANRATEPRVFQEVSTTSRSNEAKLLPRMTPATLTFAF